MAKAGIRKDEPKAATRLKRARPGDLSIRREARGKGFRYLDAGGMAIRDEATLARIRSLAIPPAYRDVQIAAVANAHLQAIGHDEAGRVQHRYHPDWDKVREKRKLDRLGRLIAALPKLREAVARDLKGRTLTRDRALACAVALIDRCHIRVGNETYAKENGSYGASTLLKRHVFVSGSTVALAFRGKSGKDIACETKDPALARTLTLLKELPGRRLFQHRRDDGSVAVLRAAEINAYIGRCAGLPVTAKDLRMLAANAAAAELLLAGEIVASETGRKRQLADIMRAISQRLVNTPAVVRKSYVHAIVVSSYASGKLKRCFEKARARGNCSRIERTLGLLTA